MMTRETKKMYMHNTPTRYKQEDWRWNPQRTYATNGVDEVLITPLNAYGNKIRELHKKLFAQDKRR